MNSRIRGANTSEEQHLPVALGGKKKKVQSGDFCSLGAMDRTWFPNPLVQTARK